MNKKLVALILSAVVAPLSLTAGFTVLRAKEQNPDTKAVNYLAVIEEHYGLHVNKVHTIAYLNDSFMGLEIKCIVEVRDFDYTGYEQYENFKVEYVVGRSFVKYFPWEYTYFTSMEFEKENSTSNHLSIAYNPQNSILGLFEYN